MNEILQQVVVTGGAILLALIGLVPAFLKRAQERRTREEMLGHWREALDGWGDTMNILRPFMILESDVDAKMRNEYNRLESEYGAAWAAYRGDEPERNRHET